MYDPFLVDAQTDIAQTTVFGYRNSRKFLWGKASHSEVEALQEQARKRNLKSLGSSCLKFDLRVCRLWDLEACLVAGYLRLYRAD